MNIFLTGEINTGKSTIIQRFLDKYNGSVGGFKTVRINTPADVFFGVYLVDINNDNVKLTKENRAGDCFPDKSLIRYKNVFDTLGVEFLTFDAVPDLIVMDELGILEKDALAFQSKVHECLDADTDVIGIIKNKDSEFLNSIRAREDVSIFEVNENNRETVLNRVIELLL